MHSHSNKAERLQHFKWCPLRFRKHLSCPICLIVIYGSMAIIGSGGAYAEYEAGEIAHASAPQADAWHLANDSGSDVVLVIVELCIISGLVAHTTRIVGAWVQILLLFVAMSLIGMEAHEQWRNPETIDPLVMILGGAIGVVANGIRFAILHLKYGGWNVNRIINDKHLRSDFAYSVGVLVAGILILISGEMWIDLATTLLILVFMARMTGEAVWHAQKGELYHH